MSIPNNATVHFVKPPVGHSFGEYLKSFISENGLAREWDGRPANYQRLPKGLNTLHVRGLSFDAQGEILAAAKKHGWSVMVHVQYVQGDDESDTHGELAFYDAKTKRSRSLSAGENSMEPMIPLSQVLASTKAQIRARYGVPAEFAELIQFSRKLRAA